MSLREQTAVSKQLLTSFSRRMIDSMKTSVVIRSYEPDAVESALKDRLMCFMLEQGRLLRQ